ncbi:MAG TPA: hypothetical protein VKS81_03390, partial [Bacteroidota bacterium]|nr:hypothetical protein [Bacteroidota bacterium]
MSLLFLAAFAITSGYGQSASVQSGLWSNPATWGGAIPTPGTDVTISSGDTVWLDVTTTVANLTIGNSVTGAAWLFDSASVTLTVGVANGDSVANYGTLKLTKHSSTLKMGANTAWGDNGGDTLYTWDLGGTNKTATLGASVNVVLFGPAVNTTTGPIIDLGFITSNSASTVTYAGTLTQTVAALNYGKLVLTGTRGADSIKYASSGTIGISNTLTNTATFGLGSLVLTGSTVNYNGAGAQSITSTSYNNLSITGTRTNGSTITVPGPIQVAGTFTASAKLKGGGKYTATGTFTYNGTGAQTITAFSYANLSITTTGRTGNVTMSGTINVSGSFSPNTADGQTYTGGKYVVSGTMNYNGTTGQAIAAPFIYNSLTVSGNKAAGNVTFSQNQTVSMTGTFTFSATNYILKDSLSTIRFHGSGAQTIPSFYYYNLKSDSSGSRTLPNGGNIEIQGVFTPGTNTYPATSCTVRYTGLGQTIAAFNYYKLVLSNHFSQGSSQVTLASGSIGISSSFVDSMSATFTTISSSNYITTGNTFNYNGTASETITAFHYYNNLVSSSTGARVLASSDTIGIAGTFTTGSNTYTRTGSTISFNGNGIQTIPVFTFNNLVLATAGIKTFAAGTISIQGNGSATGTASGDDSTNSGTIAYTGAAAQTIIASTPTPTRYYTLSFNSTGVKTFTAGIATIHNGITNTGGATFAANTGSVVDFSGTVSQVIPVGAYYSLISGSTGARTLSSGTITIAGAFTRGSNSYTTTGNTISYNGTSNQFVTGFSYNILTIANSGGATATLSGSDTVGGNFTINSGSVFKDSTFRHHVGGNWTNSGTFTGTGFVRFTGSTPTISGATKFDSLTIGNSSAAVTVASNDTAAYLYDTTGATITVNTSDTITVTTPANRLGSGIIIGSVTLSGSFSTGKNYSFEGPYNYIRLNTATSIGGLSSITSTVALTVPSDFPSGNTPVARTYTVAFNGSPGTYTSTI